jgi:hypothetical protein
LPCGDADQADDGAQQRRFARAVAAGDGQNLAGGHGKAHARENVAAAAVTGQITAESRISGVLTHRRMRPLHIAANGEVAGHFIDHLLLIWHKS